MSTRSKVMLVIAYLSLLMSSVMWAQIAVHRQQEIDILKRQLNNAQQDRRACRGTDYL
jgi:hypothetical protein